MEERLSEDSDSPKESRHKLLHGIDSTKLVGQKFSLIDRVGHKKKTGKWMVSLTVRVTALELAQIEPAV